MMVMYNYTANNSLDRGLHSLPRRPLRSRGLITIEQKQASPPKVALVRRL